jgi:succinoglycan biosynthesis protein ExoM
VKPTIDVCVATYKRPELLKKLLLSLAAQETAGEFSFTIIVVDNDAERTAETVACEFRAGGRKITYDVEPEQNISLARNKSVSHATADYIATIDDDLYADRYWLVTLYRALTSHNADVAHGPDVPEFPEKTPDYIRNCAIFNRPNPSTGSTENYIFTTANSLFRRKLIEGVPGPFDPRFGRSGGEDTDFFNQFQKRGCRMIWCREALVFGPVPSARANLAWIVKRSFRNGNMCHRYPNNPDSIGRMKIPSSCKIFVRLGRAAVYTVRAVLNPKSDGIKCLMRVAYNLGILAYYVNFHYEEYRTD